MSESKVVIPDAAVEAALNAFYRGSAPVHPHDIASMRAALEAAAPHMMEQAWDEGYFAAVLQAKIGRPARNPYR
jgi:hypothetical protein